MTPREFFESHLPATWTRWIQEQTESFQVEPGASAEIWAARFGLTAQVEGRDGGRFFLEVANGSMRPTGRPESLPLLTLGLSAEDWQGFVDTVGGASPEGIPAAVSPARPWALTPGRIERIRELTGTLRLRIRGPRPWGCTIHLGAPPLPDPTAQITLQSEDIEALWTGELNVRRAVLRGKLSVDGDLRLPWRVALALVGSD